MPAEIEPRAAVAWLAGDPRPRLVDCREEDEFAICNIAGAELIPLTRWVERAAQVLPDPDQPILIYCHHGMRSMQAARWLEARGYTDVRSLTGGIERWSAEIDPTVPRY
jgi:rhodanese-related sulfurtransferase